jgi:GTP-binding protein Era
MKAAYQYKSGFVAVMGRPNVGKSTLVNALLGQKIAAVSPRPQTTRKHQLGILTLEDAQIVFVDTPGVHRPRHKLGERMNEEAQDALMHCELVLFLVDASQHPTDEDRLLASRITGLHFAVKTMLVLNKIDLLPANSAQELTERQAVFHALLPQADVFAISATRGDNREALLAAMLERLPEGEPFYPEEQVTDMFDRRRADPRGSFNTLAGGNPAWHCSARGRIHRTRRYGRFHLSHRDRRARIPQAYRDRPGREHAEKDRVCGSQRD